MAWRNRRTGEIRQVDGGMGNTGSGGLDDRAFATWYLDKRPDIRKRWDPDGRLSDWDIVTRWRDEVNPPELAEFGARPRGPNDNAATLDAATIAAMRKHAAKIGWTTGATQGTTAPGTIGTTTGAATGGVGFARGQAPSTWPQGGRVADIMPWYNDVGGRSATGGGGFARGQAPSTWPQGQTAATPTQATPGFKAPYSTDIEAYKRALPAANKIAPRAWLRLDQDSRDFLMSGFEARGDSANYIEDQIRRSLPQFRAPRVGMVA